MNAREFMNKLRKGSRAVHRDLSFFFSGVIIIYAVSGFVLNHKKDFNSDYSIRLYQARIDGAFPKTKDDFTKEYVLSILETFDEEKNYTKHYFPADGKVKVFIKGGSSLVVDMQTGDATYESVKKRPVISSFNKLHYNPGKWWTVFSDIFTISLVIITLTGAIIVKGPKGLVGRGGIVLLAGMAVPLIFILLS